MSSSFFTSEICTHGAALHDRGDHFKKRDLCSNLIQSYYGYQVSRQYAILFTCASNNCFADIEEKQIFDWTKGQRWGAVWFTKNCVLKHVLKNILNRNCDSEKLKTIHILPFICVQNIIISFNTNFNKFTGLCFIGPFRRVKHFRSTPPHPDRAWA